MPKGSAEMVAAAVRTIFAQPDAIADAHLKAETRWRSGIRPVVDIRQTRVNCGVINSE
ncbi:hypothetical protein [Mycobacterium riyadhense]|uniref:hypothetical protein n=1 Tax=Mycobacterium riyadhense TaxID=486698 RepID=UPI003B969EBD